MVEVIFKKSPKKDKKLRAIFTSENKKKVVDFGASGYMDYTLYYKRDGKEKANEKKKAYLSRHKVNEDWSNFMSPGSLSRYILWDKPTIAQSITSFKKRFNLN